MRKYFLWMLVISIAVMIFCFSTQSGEESNTTSDSLSHVVLKASSETYREMSVSEQKIVQKDVRVLVRKAAHFIEFSLLGGALYALCREYRRKASFWMSICIGVVYAMTDELHQFFSDGRSASIRDVGIDSAGVLTGVLLLVGWISVFYRRKNDALRSVE